MRFDAKYFIDRCNDAGLSLTRMGNMVHYTTNGKPIAGAALFIEAVRKHKRQLLKHLPERNGPVQLDLFESDN